MIFVGDIALPYANSVKINEMSSKLSDHYWFGNLEGGIIDNANNAYQNSRGVFNDISATKELIEVFNF